MLTIPEPLTIEHEELHARLVRLTRANGAVGEAAREVARALHAHFEKEERLALPPLALLAPLSRGEMPRDAAQVLPLTRELAASLPTMLAEHRAIVDALGRLRDAARDAGDAEAAGFADALALHARAEEAVTYPAAILVGLWVEARLAAAAGA